MQTAFYRNVSMTAVLVFATTATAFSQTSGQLSGSVVDTSGASVPGAKLSLRLAGSETAILSSTTSSDGNFFFAALRPAGYSLAIEAPGFSREVLNNIKIDTSRETALGAIKLSVSTSTETISVSATSSAVQTANAEISATVSNEQLRRLPQLNRNPLALIATQAGVGSNGRTSTTINGLRVTYNAVTIDGINIQDNFIRTNALDYTPNLPLTDQIAEMTITTSNTNASQGGGVGQVAFITPSGTNTLRGTAYWYNRNNATAANGWFNNRDGVARPFLNQNQFGGSVGGPIKKDKLFFFVNAEGLRLRQQSSVNRTMLTDDAKNGIFTYEAGGQVRKVNLLQVTAQSADAEMKKLIGLLPAQSVINNYRTGDSRESLLRNTAGYSFVRRSNRSRENLTSKVDYYMTDKSTLTGSYSWNQDILDRPTVTATGFTPVPDVTNNDRRNLVSVAWRWTPAATLTNELRGGFNLAPANFINGAQPPAYFVGGTIFSNPIETLLNQGRYVNTYNFLDNANWVKGKHQVSFGFQSQIVRSRSYNDGGIVPTYNLGINPNQRGIVAADIPGAPAAEITAANNLLSNIAGLLNTASRTFNVKDRTSGFVAGQTNQRNFTNDTYAGFIQDSWRVRRGFTLNLGVRYDYYARVNERDSLYLLPILTDGNPINTLLGNGTLDFAGNAVGRPIYKKDMNNFAPNFGMAWDVRGDGSTAIRAGYSINYVNDNHLRTIQNSGDTNAGLSQGRTETNLAGALNNRPQITVPAYSVPRTFRDNFLLNPTGAFGTVNPNLSTPYVQQWNISIQKRLKGGVLDVRYLGNKGTQLFRAFDYNQVDINAGGFLGDFNRALNNANLSNAAGQGFNPAYTGAGSQPLTVFPLIGQGGALTNATVRNLLQTQQPGELATFYFSNGLTGPRSTSPINSFRNGLGLAANILNNYSNSTYNAFQVDYSKRFAKGFQFQTNYTWSKSLSDADGTGQTGFEAFLDANNAKLEKAITSFNVPHSWKANFVYELPFGKGKSFLDTSNGVVNRIVGGWAISGLMTYQSGNPFSILSERGTLNRAARSGGTNTATSNLDFSQLQQIVTQRVTGGGPFIISAAALGADGRGVGADGAAAFTGQAFFNPGAGTLGALQRRMFSGPAWYNGDFGILKSTQITERQSVEFRMESTNSLNNSFFYSGDQSINSVNFGRMTATQNTPRRVQFGLYYRF